MERKDYGEPWAMMNRSPGRVKDATGEYLGVICQAGIVGRAQRAIACVNTLAGVPDDQLSRVREVLREAGLVGKDGGK